MSNKLNVELTASSTITRCTKKHMHSKSMLSTMRKLTN